MSSSPTQQETTQLLLPPVPPAKPLHTRIFRFGFVYLVFQPGLMLLVAKLWFKQKFTWLQLKDISRLVSSNRNESISRDPALLEKVCTLESAKPYLGQLEYQQKEGYCAPATLRCILKSFSSFPTHMLPPPTKGPSDPNKWSQAIKALQATDNDGNNHNTNKQDTTAAFRTEIVSGDCGYEAFMEGISKVNNSKCRVAVNFLRPALVGFARPRWMPVHLILGLFGGHFSPILGILKVKEEPWIAVFDVNARYGLYLVRAKDLYESVKARDLMTGQSRAVIVVSQQ